MWWIKIRLKTKHQSIPLTAGHVAAHFVLLFIGQQGDCDGTTYSVS